MSRRRRVLAIAAVVLAAVAATVTGLVGNAQRRAEDALDEHGKDIL